MSLRRLKKDIEKMKEKSSKYESILGELVENIINVINSCDDRDIRSVLSAGVIQTILEHVNIDGYLKVGILEYVKENIIYKYRIVSSMLDKVENDRPHVAF
ncbi:MAG: hypothetical protein DRP01_07000 [Archaeoglobales archaeon]|nr:MAG: hypothetical protein DRP01_07000 [Archaeoglobales archaeon]